MKKLLIVFALLCIPSLASAQCNGVFPNNTVCGNITGANNTPRATNPSAFLGAAGGTNGQIQFNNAGALGGFTQSGDCTTNTTTGVTTCTKINGVTVTTTGGSTNDVMTYNGTSWIHTALMSLINTICTATPSICAPLFGHYSVLWYGAVTNYNATSGAAMSGGSTTISGLNGLTSNNVGNYIAVQNAGSAGATLYTTIVSITNSTTAVLATGNTSGGAISSKFAEWGTDQAAAFQAAWNACLAGSGSVYVPFGQYFVSQLNMTNANSGCYIYGDGPDATTLFPLQISAYSTTHGHMFDMAGSAFIGLRNLQIGAFYTLATPTTAIFMAQVTGSSNRMRLEHLYVSGNYNAATFYDYGVPSLYLILDCDFYNYNTSNSENGAGVLTATNFFNLSSGFVTITTGTQSTSDIMFAQTEFHRFSGASAAFSVLYLDGVGNVSFFSGVISGGANFYVSLLGPLTAITFHNVTMETESQPVGPSFAYNVNSGMTLTSLDDVGSSYVTSSGKFSSTVTSTNTVQFSH